MTAAETSKILAVLKTAYPASYQHMTVTDLKMMVKVWSDMLSDCDYGDVNNAVKAYITTNESNFAPSVGKIRSLIVKLNSSESGRLTAQEASTILLKAIANSGYHAAEEFEKLPPIIQRVVREPQALFEWSQMNMETLHSVIMSNFQRSYQVALRQETENARLPEDLRRLQSSVGSLVTKLNNNQKTKELTG